MKNIHLLIIIVQFFPNILFSQIISNQDAKFIVELETVQSPISNTFISCSMKRLNHISTSNEQVLIHRSIDNAASWVLVEELIPASDKRLIDPVITVDNNGNYYLVLIRIENTWLPVALRTSYLDLYRSTDDGVTWQFVSSPYSDIYPDYPQIISKGNGELFLTFGNSIDSTEQNIKFMKSVDGGLTWNSPIDFNYPNTQQTDIGIPDLNWGPDSTIQLSFGSSLYKGPCNTESHDLGSTWSNYLFADQSTALTNTSVLSKVVSNPSINFYGILSHRPHSTSTTISYHYKQGNNLGTTIIGQGAYGEGLITSDSILHVIYNEYQNDTFRINYVVSGNQGITFSNPIVLYSAPFEIGEFGEYQSLVLGEDNDFYLTFCDWADSSRAKTLIFEPLTIDFNPSLGESNEKRITEGQYTLYPNPFDEKVTIEYSKTTNILDISISTLDGKNILVIKPDFKQENCEIDLSLLSKGVYIVRFREKDRYIIRKIIKNK